MKNELKKNKLKPKLFKTNFYNPYDTKKRTRTTKDQLCALETIFQCSPKPPLAVRRELSAKLEMPMRNVQVWFQNRRAKAKSTNSYPVPPEDVALNEAGSFEAARMVKNIKSLTVTIPPTCLDTNNIPVSHLMNHSGNHTANYMNPNLNMNSPFGNAMNMFSYPQTPWSAQMNPNLPFEHHNTNSGHAISHGEFVSFLRTSPTTDFPPTSQLLNNNFMDIDNRSHSQMTCPLPSSLNTPFSAGLLTSPFHMNLDQSHPQSFIYTPHTENFPFDTNHPNHNAATDHFYHQAQPVPTYSQLH